MKYKSGILKSIVSLIIFVILFLVVSRFKLMHHLSIHSIVRHVSRRRKRDELYFLILYSLKPVLLFIPSSMMSIAGGTLFGPIKGFIMNMAGFFLSGTMAFYLGRFLGKDFVDRMVKGKVLELDKGLKKNGFKVMFLLRFPPIFPFDVLSYAAGLTKISYKDFILGSLLGVIPETICYSYVGKEIGQPLTYKLFIPIFAMVLIAGITTFVYKKNKHIIEAKHEV